MNYIWIFLHFITISIKNLTYYVEKEEIINLILYVKVGNYRGITILATIGQLFESIVKLGTNWYQFWLNYAVVLIETGSQ